MKLRIFKVFFLLVAPWLGAVAQAQPVVTVAVGGNAITGTGSAVIDLTAVGNENTTTFTLTWDPTVLSYVDDFAGTAIPTDGSATINRNKTQTSAGQLGLLIGLKPGATFAAGTSQLLVVNFAVVGAGSPGTSVAFVDLASKFPKKKVFDVKGEAITTATFSDAKIAAHPARANPHGG
jgi:hypothetical protein